MSSKRLRALSHPHLPPTFFGWIALSFSSDTLIYPPRFLLSPKYPCVSVVAKETAGLIQCNIMLRSFRRFLSQNTGEWTWYHLTLSNSHVLRAWERRYHISFYVWSTMALRKEGHRDQSSSSREYDNERSLPSIVSPCSLSSCHSNLRVLTLSSVQERIFDPSLVH